MKLAPKLLLPILSVVTIGLFVATIFTYTMSSRVLEDSSADMQKMAIANAMKELESGLDFNILNAISLSQTGLLQPFLSGDPTKAAENLDGAQARVRNMKNTYSYAMLGVITPAGACVAHTEPSFMGKNFSSEKFFQEALGGKVAIGDPFLYNNDVVYIVAAPVYTPEKKIIGVVFNASKMVDTMSERMHLGEKGYVLVADSQGTVFIHKDKSAVLKTNIRSEDWGRSMLSGKKGHLDFSYKGADLTTYYDTLPRANWLAVAVADMDEVLAPVKSIRNNSALIAAVLLLIVGGVVFITVRGILASLRVGTEFACLVAEGNFASRWQTKNKDEIGDLAHKLNTAFERVADQAQWYVNILDSIPIIISVTDTDKKWTFVNQAALTDIGGKREELVGRSCLSWGSGATGDSRVGLSGLGHGISRSEFNAKGKTFDVTAAYLTDRNNKQVGHVEVLQDASEQSRLKREAAEAVRKGQLEAAAKLESVVSIVSQVSSQLSTKISQADNGAKQVAARMNDTSQAMQNMSSVVMAVRHDASEASSVAEGTRNKAKEGSHIVGQMVSSIGDVQTKAQSLKSDMETLSKQAESIGEVLTVISDIADQTNLLALNAAIEAARAGDMGRGFAVVADEVRKLAEKTMQATSEVGSAIRAVQQSARTNMTNVDQAVETIVGTTSQGHRSGSALEEIVGMSEGTSNMVQRIATAAEEQSASTSQINTAIENANNIANDVSIAMSEASHGTEELARQTGVLRNLIEEMKNG